MGLVRWPREGLKWTPGNGDGESRLIRWGNVREEVEGVRGGCLEVGAVVGGLW